MDDPIANLLAKQAIAEVIFRYCRAIDRCDAELLASCFHADATHNHGVFEGPSVDFCGFALQLIAMIGSTQHHVGNVLIEVDGTRAHSEAYWVAYHRILANGPGEQAGLFASHGIDEDLFIGGRYIDRFENRGSQWRIAHRIGVHDWQRYETAAERDFTALPANMRGMRGRQDASYWKDGKITMPSHQ